MSTQELTYLIMFSWLKTAEPEHLCIVLDIFFIVPQFTENTVTFRKASSSQIYSDIKPAASSLPNPFVYLEAQQVSKVLQYILGHLLMFWCSEWSLSKNLHLMTHVLTSVSPLYLNDKALI